MGYMNDGPSFLTLLILIIVVVFYDLFFGIWRPLEMNIVMRAKIAQAVAQKLEKESMICVPKEEIERIVVRILEQRRWLK